MNTVNAIRWPPPTYWVAASRALLRPVLTSEPYPHIHSITVRVGTYSGQPLRITRRGCAACAERGQR